MRVKDVFGSTARAVVTIEPSETIADVVDLLKEHSIGAIVVSLDNKSILGIISERDVVRHLAREQEGTLRVKVEDLMTEQVTTCQLDDDVEATMLVMTAGRFRHMPIVNSSNELCGLVSLGDLVKARLQALEAENIELREPNAET
jgi:CBS domain-containing protein